MLPTPAMRRWSSTKDLIGALRARAWARRCSSGERRGQRLDAQPRAQVGVACGGAGHEVPGAEPPRVVVDEPVPAVQGEAHAGVRRIDRRIEQQRPGHAQVHEQVAVLAQPPHQVLARAAHLLDHSAAHRLGHRERQRGPRPATIQDLHPLEGATLQVRGKLAADRLDLGKLGHRPLLKEGPAGEIRRLGTIAQPRQHGGAYVGQDAVMATTGVAGETGQQRRLLAGVVGAR